MTRFHGIIRRAAPADVPAITQIYNQAVHDRVATCDLSDVPEAGRSAWLARHRPPYGVFAAEQDGRVQGWMVLAPYDPKPCFHRTATFSTYVRREMRGRGVGTALREFMLDEARARGFHALVNRVWANNEVSIAFAKRFGFQQVACLPELVEIDGRYVDCLLFELLLAPGKVAAMAPMRSSPNSTATAEESTMVSALLGEPRGRTVLDFGGADVRLATELIGRGADYLGLVPDERSRAELDAALSPGPGELVVADPDRWAGQGVGTVDAVVSVRAPQYVRNLARLLETLHHHVAAGGKLVFTVDHPVADAGTDGYFQEGERPELPRWAGRPARHRTFGSYVRELRYCGFGLVELAENPHWAAFSCVRR